MTTTCNVCRKSEWGDMGSREGVRCTSCESLERTRVIKLFLDQHWHPTPDSRVLHFAPEKGLHAHLSSLKLKEYRTVDFIPKNFKFANVEKFDLCSDGPKLPSDTYDLILHAHVMEHIPCNVAAVLSHIHRSLSPNGLHLMCVPFMSGGSEEDFSPLKKEDALKRFGQSDHVRRFGKEGVDRNIGMIFRIPNPYSITDYFPLSILERHNIPKQAWYGYTGTSVFPLSKSDYLLSH